MTIATTASGAWAQYLARCVLVVGAIAAPLVHAQPVSATDDSGNTVSLPAPAQRVISLAPHITELVYAAGAGDKLVGVVSYSDYPPQAKTLPIIGSNNSLDLEGIVALHPDLVIVWPYDNAQPQIDRLRALHIPLFFSAPRRLDDVATSLQRIGTLLGTESTAQTAASEYRLKIDRLRAHYAHRPTVDVFYQVWDNPLMTLNGTQFISDVIAMCGGRNVFANLPSAVTTLSTESVLAAAPEAIVSASPGVTAPEKHRQSLERWLAWPTLTAVARGNLFTIDGDLINRPAPRLAQGAARLCEDLEEARLRRPTGGAAPR